MKILNFLILFFYTITINASDQDRENKKSFLEQRKEQEIAEHYNARLDISRLEKTLTLEQVKALKEKNSKKKFAHNSRLQEALAYSLFENKQKSYDRIAAMSPLSEYGKNSDLSIIINEPGFVSVEKSKNVPMLDFDKAQRLNSSLEDQEVEKINYQKEAQRIVHEIKSNTNNDYKESFDLNDFDMCEQEDN